MMDTWSARRTVSPITPQVHGETADGLGAVRAHYPQGWTRLLTHQAGYRRAVRPGVTIASHPLAPPRASL